MFVINILLFLLKECNLAAVLILRIHYEFCNLPPFLHLTMGLDLYFLFFSLTRDNILNFRNSNASDFEQEQRRRMLFFCKYLVAGKVDFREQYRN